MVNSDNDLALLRVASWHQLALAIAENGMWYEIGFKIRGFPGPHSAETRSSSKYQVLIQGQHYTFPQNGDTLKPNIHK